MLLLMVSCTASTILLSSSWSRATIPMSFKLLQTRKPPRPRPNMPKKMASLSLIPTRRSRAILKCASSALPDFENSSLMKKKKKKVYSSVWNENICFCSQFTFIGMETFVFVLTFISNLYYILLHFQISPNKF